MGDERCAPKGAGRWICGRIGDLCGFCRVFFSDAMHQPLLKGGPTAARRARCFFEPLIVEGNVGTFPSCFGG